MKDLKAAYKTIEADHFAPKMEISFIDGDKRETLHYEKVTWNIGGEEKGLRYGENPGQEAALYRLLDGNLRLGEVEMLQPGRYLASVPELLQSGKKCGYCASAADLPAITAKSVAAAAAAGDSDALGVYAECGEYLGRGVSVLIDILNPERIVIGSIFERAQNLLAPAMNAAIKREALGAAAAACQVVPAALGDSIGDYAAVSLAVEGGLGNL